MKKLDLKIIASKPKETIFSINMPPSRARKFIARALNTQKTGPISPDEYLRNWDIVGKVLMPTATLESVAKEYSLTRQRIQQIFDNTVKISSSKMKSLLKQHSDKFLCPWCGETKPSSKNTYCSSRCRQQAAKYNLKEIKKCEYCKREFIEFRGLKYQRLRRRARGIRRIGDFCCFKHYWLYMHENEGWSIENFPED